MKRIVWLLLAVGLKMSGLLPFESNDVAKLAPVEALTVTVREGQVILDGGRCRGCGETWDEALEDLHHGAEGTVFLGTAEQVILSQEAVELLPQVVRCRQLRPAAAICICRGTLPEPEEAAAYLNAHDAGVTLRQVQAAMLQGRGIALPMLENTEGGLRLYGSADR